MQHETGWCAYVIGDIVDLPKHEVAAVYATAHAAALASTAPDRAALVSAWLKDAVCVDDYYAGPCFTFALCELLGGVPSGESDDALDRQIIREAAYRDVLLADAVARDILHAGLRDLGFA